jgi:hypothetical protein
MFAQSYLCVDRNTFELAGLLVKRLDSLEFSFFTVTAEHKGSDITFFMSPAASPTESTNNEIEFVGLPAFPYPQKAFTFLACASMGVPRRQKTLALAPKDASEAVIRQWMLLVYLDEFGIRLRSADHVVVGQMTTEQFPSLQNPPFNKMPVPEDFQIDESALPISDADTWPLQVEIYSARFCDQVVRLMEGDNSGAFDSDDVTSFGDELKLSIRSDQLLTPLVVGSHQYASAEYWVCSANSKTPAIVKAFIGLLTFYHVEGECWMGYLLHYGSIMTEIAMRRAKHRGYRELLVWTTQTNTRAREFYQLIGFVVATDRFPRDNHGEVHDCIAFRAMIDKL